MVALSPIFCQNHPKKKAVYFVFLSEKPKTKGNLLAQARKAVFKYPLMIGFCEDDIRLFLKIKQLIVNID